MPEEHTTEAQAIVPTQVLPHAGTIRINVQGAFIVDHEDVVSDFTMGPANHGSKRETEDIRLPHQNAVVSHVAIDVGGSLVKLVYFSHEPKDKDAGGRLTFLKFETERILECIDFIQKLREGHQEVNGNFNQTSSMHVVATGGGAFKYNDMIREKLGVEVQREDEMECLIIGLDFFITEIPSEVFSHDPTGPPSYLPLRPPASIYPYLLVNIGSGVSMIKVSGPREFQRIGGTSLGGGTLWGLLSLLTGARNFDDMLALADKGDNSKVDMLVGDIYGEGMGYSKIGLKADTIASSFGKVYKMKREAEEAAEDGGGLANVDSHRGEGPDSTTRSIKPERPFGPEDISRSLLYAVSYNIGNLSYLQSEKHGLSHLYFGGSFIRGHRQTMDTLSYAIRYWSGGQKQAFFLRHEGYLGAVGAFLKRQTPGWGRRSSFDKVT